MSAMTTRAPSSISIAAVAWPMPPAPPVTIATLPASSCVCMRGTLRPVFPTRASQQSARDDKLLDLVGAFADHHQRRVAVVALDRELIGVAHTSMDAHGIHRQLQCCLTCEQLGHAGLDVAPLAGHLALGCAACEQPGRLQPRRHLGELELDRLVLSDRLAERRPQLGVTDRCVERRTRHPDRAGSDVDTSDLERTQDLRQAAPELADEVRAGDAVVGIRHLDGLDALVAELADLLAHGDAPEPGARLLLDDERAHARIGLGGQYDEGGALAVGHPRLRAVDDPLIAVTRRAAGDAARVTAGVRLGEGERAALLARRHR